MDSHQSVVSPFKNYPVVTEPERQKSGFGTRNSNGLAEEIGVHDKEDLVGNLDGFMGLLEVYVHQARDIHNICIYHKQDVYAKLCLTSDPETTVSTQIINGGGKNPVFNDTLRLNVRTVDSSLKCEIWMLSRVKNYLEDQLLGFALVPLSDVLIGNGKLAQEFSLSSTDLFHSPAGFVQLSLSYSGASPEVMAISVPCSSLVEDKDAQDSEIPDSLPSDYDKIEFPDPKIANEDHLMVSEYYKIQCTNLDSQNSESFGTSDTDNHHSSDMGAHVVESFSAGSLDSIEVPKNFIGACVVESFSAGSLDSIEVPKNFIQVLKNDTPSSSVSTNGSPASIPASSQSFCDTPGASKSLNQDLVPPMKEKRADVGEVESDSSGGLPSNTYAQSVLSVNIEPEKTVVQQDIVDMYLKSMQQFTESLAKMKLPMDIENGSTNSGNSSSDQKLKESKGTGSRVFYGSRAFF
ncbi:hypothetical protein HHK36_023960 [Tetracentron sinense]|uniref:C2 domain-containing protein n=1 Tax=Tetracentron sinense TaxID=13715 RepID=A0A835D5P4_TETSI|nr:hypothetical protein HHK36_023960 [Tetracentron sinense]